MPFSLKNDVFTSNLLKKIVEKLPCKSVVRLHLSGRFGQHVTERFARRSLQIYLNIVAKGFVKKAYLLISPAVAVAIFRREYLEVISAIEDISSHGSLWQSEFFDVLPDQLEKLNRLNESFFEWNVLNNDFCHHLDTVDKFCNLAF